MAAYAAVVSLMNTIHLIQNHPRYSFSFAINQIASLSENAQIFLKFVESFNSSHQRREDLEIQIASVACLAENALVSLTVDQIRAGSALDHGGDEVPKCSSFLSNLWRLLPSTSDADYCNSSDLEKVIDRMSSIVEEVTKVQNESSMKKPQSTGSVAVAASTRSPTMGTTSMVGFDDYKIQLMEKLRRDLSTLQIISVHGMGGIGKTTLAKNVYDVLENGRQFDVYAWATVSQDHDIKKILLRLLDREDESTKDTSEELGLQLHKKLWGRKYLIILDDMWSTDVWDGIRSWFPDNDKRSRIVITTRITNVSSHLSSSPLELSLLDDKESWKLFCATTFGEEECPSNLDKIGKSIIRKCGGLPLSIVVIGGHLKKCSRVTKEWETIDHDMMSFLDSGEDQCLSILSLSYTHLPAYLKPCFLYMGGFSEDRRIDVETVIRFWVAEGFLQPDGARSFEEIADSYLEDLVDRNLVLVQEKGWNGKIKTCRFHDLLREVCLKVGREERFFCVLKHGGGSSRCKHEEGFGGSEKCLAAEKYWQRSRLVEDVMPFIEEEGEVLDPHYLEELFDRGLELRYIFDIFLLWQAQKSRSLPPSISTCWNLQTLIICTSGVTFLAPSEIWEMPWLRHLNILQSIHLPDPPKRHFVMQSLHTLMVVENLKLSGDVCGRIPDIKDLHLYYDLEESKVSGLEYCPNNLDRLEKLESLTLRFADVRHSYIFVRYLTYPSTLQKLHMEKSILRWEDLSVIGTLPHLEVFSVDLVHGKEWSPIEGQFLRLRSLRITCCCDLVCWNAESSHFPVLETLTFAGTFELMEFPWAIGEIPTLQHVTLGACNVSVAISAIEMLLEQEECGNEDLRLQIQFDKEEDHEIVKQMVQEKGIKSKNLFLEQLKKKEVDTSDEESIDDIDLLYQT